MTTRGSKVSRVLDYFRTADKDEVRVVATLAAEVLQSRGIFTPQVPVGTAAVKRAKRSRKVSKVDTSDGQSQSESQQALQGQKGESE